MEKNMETAMLLYHNGGLGFRTEGLGVENGTSKGKMKWRLAVASGFKAFRVLVPLE